MAGTLRQAVPKLLNLSPTLAEALIEIENTIQKIQQDQEPRASTGSDLREEARLPRRLPIVECGTNLARSGILLSETASRGLS